MKVDPTIPTLDIWHSDGSRMVCDPRGEPALRAAVERYLGDGDSAYAEKDGRDTLVDLTTIAGARYTCRASSVYSWSLTTAETRRTANDLLDAIEAHRTGAVLEDETEAAAVDPDGDEPKRLVES